ncbi:MAG: DUF5996 family protein [Phycisphaeraceae bacterium]
MNALQLLMTEPSHTAASPWPSLAYEPWQPTCTTLHLWLQVAGKVRLALTPWVNHSWHATFYVTPRGLTSSPIPYGRCSFELDFDFLNHELRIPTSEGNQRQIPLAPQTVADFHRKLLEALEDLGLNVQIHGLPSEVPDPIPFADDTAHRDYDPVAARRYWQVLVQVDRVFKHFRTGYLGKASPVHLFWGALDLAVTRFSGRRAPLHPGGVPGLPDEVTREAYSHEVSSAGFWPGSGIGYPAFYSYAYPEPAGFRDAAVEPKEALYDAAMGEFLLPYETVRTARDPEAMLLKFLQSTYEAAADGGGWERAELEGPLGQPGVPRKI